MFTLYELDKINLHLYYIIIFLGILLKCIWNKIKIVYIIVYRYKIKLISTQYIYYILYMVNIYLYFNYLMSTCTYIFVYTTA